MTSSIGDSNNVKNVNRSLLMMVLSHELINYSGIGSTKLFILNYLTEKNWSTGPKIHGSIFCAMAIVFMTLYEIHKINIHTYP